MNITMHDLLYYAAIWYGIGICSSIFWSFVTDDRRYFWRKFSDKPGKTIMGILYPSIWGPILFFVCLFMWIIVRAVLKK